MHACIILPGLLSSAGMILFWGVLIELVLLGLKFNKLLICRFYTVLGIEIPKLGGRDNSPCSHYSFPMRHAVLFYMTKIIFRSELPIIV
jgi:hypothetical protein